MCDNSKDKAIMEDKRVYRKTTLINFKATPAFKERLDSVAREQGMKTSKLIREAIEAKLDYSERLSGKEKMPE